MVKKPVYLDVCALSRPFDDQDYMRIRMESVKRHREWQKMLNKDSFFNDIFAEE